MFAYNKFFCGLTEPKINIDHAIYFTIKFIKIIFIIGYLFYLCFYRQNENFISKYNSNSENNIDIQNSKLISDNFFIIDSNNLNNIVSHMYGFSVSINGILTDNYYKQLGKYNEPEPQGVYVMIRKIGKEIIINQDFYGSYGLYIFENKENNYFALSNSFLLLEDYLVGKQNISLNKDFSNHLIVTGLCSFSLEETLINEIKQIPSDAFITINIKKKNFKINKIDYKENSIPLESEEGLKTIDSWIDKWGYIFRSLNKQTDNVSSDLSGGFDTRILLSILLNSGVDVKEIHIKSNTDTKHDHDIDFKIASDLSLKYGFKINNFILDNNITKWSLKDILYNTFYSKLGFHKEFYMKKGFFNKPRFSFSGSGGEFIRGGPNIPINEYINLISSNQISGYEDELYNSSKKILYNSVFLLKNQTKYYDDYEISYDLYSKALGRYHFGKSAVENFITNLYILQPLMDPEIKKIKFNVSKNNPHDLISYIYVRLEHDLIKFPFQGNRNLNQESIKKAENLNQNYKPYKIKFDYNNKFYIDEKRMSPVVSNEKDKDVYECFNKLFKSFKYIDILNKLYNKNVYNWANEYSHKINFQPFTHHYALLAIAITEENLLLNAKYMNISEKNTDFKEKQLIINLINKR